MPQATHKQQQEGALHARPPHPSSSQAEDAQDSLDSRDCERESLEKAVTHTLEEARMVLPGVQALFGFQLIAIYNSTFHQAMSSREQHGHLAAVLLTALSIAFMMSPAAYHRQAELHTISQRFLKLASRLITAGMFALMLALHIDCYLVARLIVHDVRTSLALTIGLGIIFLGLWFVLPQLMRRIGAPTSARNQGNVPTA